MRCTSRRSCENIRRSVPRIARLEADTRAESYIHDGQTTGYKRDAIEIQEEYNKRRHKRDRYSGWTQARYNVCRHNDGRGFKADVAESSWAYERPRRWRFVVVANAAHRWTLHCCSCCRRACGLSVAVTGEGTRSGLVADVWVLAEICEELDRG